MSSNGGFVFEKFREGDEIIEISASLARNRQNVDFVTEVQVTYRLCHKIWKKEFYDFGIDER